MRKAKKKVHPMPKLGWKDLILYWSGMILTGGGALAANLIPLLVRKNIAFANPDAIATDDSTAGFHCLWLMIWLATVCCLIVVLYHKRFPVFGRTDIKYGPPAYPRVFPLLMKDPPQYWQSPKKLAFRKKVFQIGATVLSVWLLIGTLLYPDALYRRIDLFRNGSVVIYDGSNQEESVYRYGDVESIQLCTTRERNGRSHRYRWYVDVIIYMKDGEMIVFRNTEFRGDWEQKLQEMMSIKRLYSGLVSVSGSEDLGQIRDDYNLTQTEVELLFQLFE